MNYFQSSTYFQPIKYVLALILMLTAFLSWSNAPDFNKFKAGIERKTAFFNYFSPLINDNNNAIAQTRKQLLQWSKNKTELSAVDSKKIVDLAKRYRVENFNFNNSASWEKLINHVDVLPPSLALAQAANESAWGTSRFVKIGNNYFGQWCFEIGCGIVPKRRSSGKTHEVAVFDNAEGSIELYMQNLNNHPTYQKLRDIRAQLRKENKPIVGKALAAGVVNYSGRGKAYIKELRAIIKFNKLEKYDVTINKS